MWMNTPIMNLLHESSQKIHGLQEVHLNILGTPVDSELETVVGARLASKWILDTTKEIDSPRTPSQAGVRPYLEQRMESFV
jgi:hypothetical protein